jgi:hypothetical protein
MSRQLVDSWFGAFQERDISMLQLADDFVHSSPFGEIEGREAYLELVAGNPEAFFGPELEVLDVIEDRDKYAVRYLVNGNPACDCIYTKGDKITKIHSYYHHGEKPSF